MPIQNLRRKYPCKSPKFCSNCVTWAKPPEAAAKDAEPARPVFSLSAPEACLVTPRLTVRTDVGDGVGYTRGYTYLEGFLPVFQTPGAMVIFVDGRGVNFDQPNQWEWNAGGGVRFYSPRSDWVYGVNSFFDWRSTGSSTFRQIGLGLEAMGPIVDLRSNFYFPVGNERNAVGFSNPQFAGTNILLDHNFENAMRGFDVEAGVPIPLLERWGMRGYLGYYHYDNTNAPTINGARGRLEARITDNLTGHLAVQNDNFFNTTVTGGFALNWGGSRRSCGVARSVTERLGERVVRDPDIVVARNADTEAAIDPNTGKRIEVRHADSNAPAGGDGSVERPYQTLAQLQGGSAAGQILFVHTNSVFVGQTITLKNAQRFLGDGILHDFTATQGSFFLPLGTGNAPVIRGGTFSTKLANNNEVSGFTYDQPGSISVIGLGINNFNINRNTFTNGVFNTGQLTIANATGSGIIAGNTFIQTTATAITAGFFLQSTSGTLRAAITDNITSGHTYSGGLIRTGGTGQIFATLRNNQFGEVVASNRGFSGEALGGSIGLQFLNNTSTQGYRLEQAGAGVFRVEDTLSTNVGPFTKIGTITVVPVGTFGFQDP